MSRVRLAAASTVLLVAQWALNMNVKNLDTAWVEPPPGSGERWNPDLFRAATVGHAPAGVDWLWIKCLQDSSLTKVSAGVHPALYFDLDLATDIDPAYYEAYVNGANLLSIVRNDNEGARDLLLKAEKFRKQDLPSYPEFFRKEFWGSGWYPSFILAYVYLFELGDLPSAALAFQEAARLEGAPAYVGRLVERLTKKGGHYDVGLRLLSFMIDGQGQGTVKEELTRKRDALMVSQYLFNANDAFQLYLNSLPRYRELKDVSHEALEAYWRRFKSEQNFPSKDPWGGALSLSADGRIVTSTPHERVLGLD